MSPRFRFPDWRPARRRGGGAFTLVEMLTAMAVLALLTAILGGLLSTMSRSWQTGQRRVNNFTKARTMLDLISRDLQMAVLRNDLAAFPNGDVAFYVMRPGVPVSGSGTVRNVSLVQYRIDVTSTASMLQRLDLAIDWADPATRVSFGDSASLGQLADATARDTTPGVVGFKLYFVQSDGTLTAAYASGIKAAVVSLAVVDDRTLLQLSQSQLTTLRSALQARANGSRSALAQWDDYLKDGLDWSQYPQSLGSGLKLFERYVVFSNF